MKFKRSIQFAKRVILASTRRDGGIERAAKYNYTSFSLRCKHSPERVSISGESITLDKKHFRTSIYFSSLCLRCATCGEFESNFCTKTSLIFLL